MSSNATQKMCRQPIQYLISDWMNKRFKLLTISISDKRDSANQVPVLTLIALLHFLFFFLT